MFKIGLSYFDLSTVTDWSKSVIYREGGEGGEGGGGGLQTRSQSLARQILIKQIQPLLEPGAKWLLLMLLNAFSQQ